MCQLIERSDNRPKHRIKLEVDIVPITPKPTPTFSSAPVTKPEVPPHPAPINTLLLLSVTLSSTFGVESDEINERATQLLLDSPASIFTMLH